MLQIDFMNTFSLILVIATVITGIAYAYDYRKLRPGRLEALKNALEACPQLSRKDQRRIKEGTGAVTSIGSLFPVILFVFLFRAFVFEPFRIPSGSMEPTLLPGDFIAVSKWSYGIRNPLTNGVWIETSKPERGDVAVFKYPEDPSIDYIKRIVGMPGDEVIFDYKRVYIRKACNIASVSPSEVRSGEGGTACEDPQPLELTPAGTLTVDGGTFQEEYLVFDEKLGQEAHRIQINPRVPDLSQYFYRQKGTMRGSWVVPEGHYFVMGDNRDNSKDSRFWGFVPEENLVGKTVAVWLSLEFDRDESSALPSFIPSAVRFSRVGGLK